MELIFADSNPDGSCSFVGHDFRGRELSEVLSWVANDFDKSCPSMTFKVIEHGFTMRTYDVECRYNYPVDALAAELEGCMFCPVKVAGMALSWPSPLRLAHGIST